MICEQRADYRRDNPTVSRRVLGLADRLGLTLEKESSSLEAILKIGSGDIYVTKTLSLAKRKEAKL
jgi:hypothetical protein